MWMLFATCDLDTLRYTKKMGVRLFPQNIGIVKPQPSILYLSILGRTFPWNAYQTRYFVHQPVPVT